MPRNASLPSALLALAFILCKLAIVWPVVSARGVGEFLFISGEDIAVALLFGLMTALAMRLTRGHPKLNTIAWRGMLTIGAVAVLYAVVNVGVYKSLSFPLNARMLTLVKQVSHLRSSMEANANMWVMAFAISGPLLYLIANQRRGLAMAAKRVRAPLLAIGIAWAIAGTLARANAEPESRLARAGKNPHRELVGSFVQATLMKQPQFEVAASFPAAFMTDFVPAAERKPSALAVPAGGPPRNVILIVLESVAAQQTSLYGSDVQTTPNLAAEQSNAVVFDRAYANAGFTYLSRLPLLYGAYPGLPWNGYLWKAKRPMPTGLARLLHEARGYRTAFFSGCEINWDRLDYTAQDAGMTDLFGPDQVGGRRASSWGTEDGLIIDGLIKWIDADTTTGADRKPFYATLWTDQTHHPYTLTGPESEREYAAAQANGASASDLQLRYQLAIRQVDRHLGKLFEALRSRGIADDTLVVITADHGEAFGKPHGLMGHGGSVFDENLRVPLMFWNPRLFNGDAARRETKTVAAHVDVLPSIAHLLGITPSSGWQGGSLFDPGHAGRAYVLDDLRGYQFGVVDERFKYVARVMDGVERLYDLHEDPLELRDVSAANPEIVTERRGRVAAFIKAQEQYVAPPTAPTSPKLPADVAPAPRLASPPSPLPTTPTPATPAPGSDRPAALPLATPMPMP